MFFYVIDTPKKKKKKKCKIRPYGLAHTDDSFYDATLAKRLKTINCEFMLRPHIGIPEFSERITENWKYVSDNIGIFGVEVINTFLQKVESILGSLQVVSQKGKSPSGKTHLNGSFVY